jgi:hypothetical protein
MSRGKFIVTFIARCTSQGIDPVEKAKEEVQRLDAELKKIGEIHRERANYVALLEQYGDQSCRLYRTTVPPSDIALEDDTEVARETHRKIIARIEHSGPMSVNELIKQVGSFKNDHVITRGVKFLSDRGIVERDDTPENKVKPGPNWGADIQ